jgi:hypothetical protein
MNLGRSSAHIPEAILTDMLHLLIERVETSCDISSDFDLPITNQ